MLIIYVHVKTVTIFMLTCSVCDKIVSTFAQRAHAIIFENYFKKQIKMQILTKNNPNFEQPSRSPSYRTKVKILREKDFLTAHQKKFGSAYAQSP